MKSFNNRSGLRGLPCFAEGIYWATGSSLTTPFTEGCPGVNNEASPPGRHQEQAPKQRCTFSSTTFSSVQFKEMKMMNETIADEPEKADDIALHLESSFKLCNCSIHGSVSPILRPFGLRFSNEMRVCWSSAGGQSLFGGLEPRGWIWIVPVGGTRKMGDLR